MEKMVMKIRIYQRTSDIYRPSSGELYPVEEVCRSLGISQATFYLLKKKYGELGAGEIRRLRQLEDEKAWLKRLLADYTLKLAMWFC